MWGVCVRSTIMGTKTVLQLGISHWGIGLFFNIFFSLLLHIPWQHFRTNVSNPPTHRLPHFQQTSDLAFPNRLTALRIAEQVMALPSWATIPRPALVSPIFISVLSHCLSFSFDPKLEGYDFLFVFYTQPWFIETWRLRRSQRRSSGCLNKIWIEAGFRATISLR